MFLSRFLLYCCCCWPLLLTARTGGDTLRLTDPIVGRLSVADPVDVRYDTTGESTLSEVLASNDFLPWRRYGGPDRPHVVWYRLHLRNTTAVPLYRAVRLVAEIKAATVYILDGEQLLRQTRTGYGVPLEEKDVYSAFNYFTVHLPPGSTRSVYVRTDYSPRPYNCCGQALQMMSAQQVLETVTKDTAVQFGYLGAMLLLALLSVLSFFLFRKRVFLYFGGVMVSFGLYFGFLYQAFGPLLAGGAPLDYLLLVRIIISGTLVSMTLFVSNYLRLRETMPRIRVVLWITALSPQFLSFTFPYWRQEPGWYRWFVLENTLVGVWVVVTIGIIARLLLRKLPEARTLALAIGLLAVGSIIQIGHEVMYLPGGFLTHYAFQVSTLFFAGLLFRELFVGFTDLRRDKQLLTEGNLLKTRFFANITHEFRTPLTLMLGPLRQVIQRTESAADTRLLRVAERNAERQLELVNQLLDLSQLDARALRLRAAPVEASAYLRRVASAYESLAAQRAVRLELDLPDPSPVVYLDAEKMDRVLYKLLTNAFKFTPAGGRISMAMTQDAMFANVIVSDTGRGIAPELLPRIFDRFFLASHDLSEDRGTGIGLALVREMMTLHHGTVDVRSQLGEGTEFTLHLPLGKDHLSVGELAGTAPATVLPHRPLIEAAAPGGGATDPARTDRPRLLLVEDNDEMRDFILQLLGRPYRVDLAADGQEGVRRALENPPDLIVSDLMMPRKDGYQLCRELKADLRTSHVPIILLTARASRDARLEGLGEGADDYLTKPFDAEELLARVSNLIRSRQVLRERFAAAITVQPAELTVTSLDQEFLTRALEHVEHHLTDEALSVDHLAAALGTSRTQLNVKLRALVNQSSNQFIQSVRLQRSAQLLADGKRTVKEVAYACGFSSPGYFGKLFRKEFGVAPGSYRPGTPVGSPPQDGSGT